MTAIEPIAREMEAEKVTTLYDVALVSVFGPDFRERPGIAGQAFKAMASQHINILAVSTSISTISCVIQDSLYDAAIEGLHNVFDLP